MNKLSRQDMVSDFTYGQRSDEIFCEQCAEGKQTRNSFKARTEIKAKQPLELVHSDVCGMGEPSLSGSLYFVTFVDDHTRYVWTYMLKRKSEVYSKFREWRAMVEKESGYALRTFRSDNGGEYISSEFEEYLKSQGIRHEYTIPKTPEQNGVAERMNRTLVEKVRCMLADSGLPKVFWAETLSTATYLHNRSPTKPLGGVTPSEAWTGLKPTVGHLRRYGCAAYAHIPKDERSKLDAKSRKCIHLGYGTKVKGYRLYDKAKKQIFHSRDVKFDEANRGYITEVEPVQKERGNIQFEELVSEEPEPPSRRSGREHRQPDWYGERANVLEHEPEPNSFADAMTRDDGQLWLEAMTMEMSSLQVNDVWDLVELPKERKLVGSKWVFKMKRDVDGNIDRYKARLVARGFTQRFGEDYDQTFSPVVRFESFRMLMALAAKHDLQLHQMDVTTAFLHGVLEEDVFMKQPEGFVKEGDEKLVCRLKRSLYGLKQSPRCWNAALDEKLSAMGFEQASGDPCLYRSKGGEMAYVAVYVDDLVIAAASDEAVQVVKDQLSASFDMKDMGRLHHFLGMKIVQDPKNNSVWIGQDRYTKDVLAKYGMENCKPALTPMDPGVKPLPGKDTDERFDPAVYQSAVGSLLFLSVATRPDIAFAVSCAARFTANPYREHWSLVKRIMRYLKGTYEYGLQYTDAEGDNLIGFSDADWAGDTGDRKSTSGYTMLLSNAAVTWKSKKQTVVALSTAEAEYVALCAATQEACWMRKILSDLGAPQSGPTTMREDNQSAIAIAENPVSHNRTKHIDIKYHYTRQAVQNGDIQLEYCPSADMLADVLTKPVYTDTFKRLRNKLGLATLCVD